MPRYPRKAYCLDSDRVLPRVKDTSTKQSFNEQDLDKLLEDCGDKIKDKIHSLHQLDNDIPDILNCPKCDFTNSEFLNWFDHRRTHPNGRFKEARYVTTIDNTDFVIKENKK